jgi:RND superfamily putative drug exporter
VGSLADLTYVRASWIVAAALVVLLAALPLASRVFDEVEPFDISDPGSEVELAEAAYAEASGQNPEAEVLLLVTPNEGAATSDGRDRIAAAAELLGTVRGIASVATPEQSPELISDDRRAGLVLGFLAADKNRVEVGEAVVDAVAEDPELAAGGVAVAAYQIGEQTERDTRRIELFAAPVLLLLLLVVFRSPLAAVLPLILAGFSIVVTLGLLTPISGFTAVDLFSLQVVTGLGVGLAIDYSLFVLARYRGELRSGCGYESANRTTLQTAGRTVGFGALTVAAALAALIIFPNQFLSSTGIAGALVALLSGAAALLVLPAVLTLLGPRIDPSFESAGPAGAVPDDPLGGGSRYWTAMSRRVMASPVPFATLALLVMLIIAAPGASGGVTTPDARLLAEGESARMCSGARGSVSTMCVNAGTWL